MIINERNNRDERVLASANALLNTIRTAPKAKGVDIIEAAIVTDEEIKHLAEDMVRLSDECGMKFLLRDAQNILTSSAIVLIGTRILPLGLNCGYCGYETCSAMQAHKGNISCALNQVDLGIAIGSACKMASEMGIDTRVMFSAGKSAKRLNYLPECHSIYALPLSCTSKSPFFDRKVEH